MVTVRNKKLIRDLEEILIDVNYMFLHIHLFTKLIPIDHLIVLYAGGITTHKMDTIPAFAGKADIKHILNLNYKDRKRILMENQSALKKNFAWWSEKA